MTRDEYVARVEPICRSETAAHQNVLRGVEEMVKSGKFRQAAPRVKRAATALQQAVRRIATVPPPPADAARLSHWIGFAKGGVSLLRKMASDLQRGDRRDAQGLANQLLREARRANATTVGFNFDYCRISPARFV